MISRFGIIDISPTTFFNGEFIGAKAVVDEAVAISATIIREGHEGFDAFAVLKLIHFMQTVGFRDVKLKKAVNQMFLEKHALEPLESEIEQLLLLREIEKV